MRLPSFARAGVAVAAGAAFSCALGLPGASVAAPRIFAGPSVHRIQAGPKRTPAARSRNATGQCSTNAATGFLGVQGASNVAAGYESAVLGGTNNEACDDWTGIGAGEGNNVGNTSDATVRSFIGGGQNNSIGQADAFIGAGEHNSAAYNEAAIVAGDYNTASGYGSIVGAGSSNAAGGESSMVGAGSDNNASGLNAFIGAGAFNSVAGTGSFIGAGGSAYGNTGGSGVSNTVPGNDSFIGAGDLNSVAGNESFIGSGQNNTIGAAALYAAIPGGGRNTANGEYSTILGGYANLASGAYAIVAGGDSNIATGVLSFAAGYHADAVHNGSFVWSDYASGSTTLKDSATNQFLVRASGGTYIYSNEAATSGVKLSAGSGSWASLSDRDAKSAVVPLDDESVPEKVSVLPLSSWQYKTERGVRHVGPMAQDFYAAFGVGEDDRHLTSIDEDGIALAAIKALHRENVRLRAREDGEIASLRAELRRLERRG